MSKFPWGMVNGALFAVAVVLTVFGWLDEAVVGVLGVTTTTAVVWLSLLGVRAVLDVRRPIPEVHARLSYPRIAALEHSEGLFDLYTSLGAEGHDPHIADACRTCDDNLLPPAGGFNTPPMTTRRDDHYEYVVYDCPACHTRSGMRIPRSLSGMSSIEYRCGACGEVRTTKLPASPVPDLLCRHVWHQEQTDRSGRVLYGCTKCTAKRTCSEGTSPYDH